MVKKPKVINTATVDGGTLDLISNLPDSLLVEILSLLPTKDAFSTCIVSKRWRYLWSSIDSFSFSDQYSSEKEDFISFIDYVFAKRTPAKIRKFHLNVFDMYIYDCQIEQWLSYVMKNNVEDVVLETNYFNMYPLHCQLFYTCTSLMTLDLCSCVFDKSAVISWKCLKSLRIRSVELGDDMIVNLLSGCPALETMELSMFSGFRRLEIRNSNLKRLKLDHFFSWYEGEYTLDIVAPYLQHLEMSGRFDDVKCRLVDVSSLVSADVAFECASESYFGDDNGSWTRGQDYLQKLSHVMELTTKTWFAEVLLILRLDGVPLPAMKCKQLTLKLQLSKYTLYEVSSFLQASPHVETLNINVEYDSSFFLDYYFICRSYDSRSGSSVKGDDTDFENCILDFAFPSLKSVKIICSIWMCSKESQDKLFDLSRFLLKNAVVLEKFVIIAAKRRKCWDCAKNCVSPYLSRLAKKLSEYPSPSTNFRVILHESGSDD